MKQTDISWLNLIAGSLIIIIPVLIFYYYKVGLNKAMLISFLRMTVQLLLVGLYLEFIFAKDSPIINLLWLILMLFVAGFTITGRTSIRYKYLTAPLIISIFANVLVNGLILWTLVVGNSIISAQYLIPIMGMVIGNSVSSTVVGMRSYFDSLTKYKELYHYFLSTGATRREALHTFIGKALSDAFSPTIASTATIGLIWLPGMMTGQILGGSSPLLAIKYQIMIVIAIFVGSIITVSLTLNLTKYFVFDKWDRLKVDAIKRH